MSFLTEDLIESVKDRSFAPISQNTFQDADILRILNEELALRLVSKIQKAREDFFITRKTVALIVNKDHYLLPSRTIGNAIKALFVVDGVGNKELLTRRDIDRIHEYSASAGDSGEFYFEGDEIALMRPPASSAETLLFVYPRRPNHLVLTSSCAKITAVNTTNSSVVFSVDTDLSASLPVNSEVDFVRNKSPFTIWSEEVAISAIDASTITVPLSSVIDVDNSVEPGVGDYICPAGQSNIAMIPEEFHPVLAEMAACRMLRSLGDINKWQAGVAVLREMETDALALIKNRAESSPERPSRKRGLLRTFRG